MSFSDNLRQSCNIRNLYDQIFHEFLSFEKLNIIYL